MNLVLHTGDDAVEKIKAFAENVSFYAIGAFRESTIAYWNWDTKEYEHIEVADQVEVLSMIGNVATSSDGRRLHAHVTLGRRGGSTIGGHLIRAIVRPTLEVFFHDAGAKLVRRKDPETGLWLLA